MKVTFNPWPVAIILTFVLFVSGTIGLIVMAASQRADLVSKNYYEQELKYQDQVDRLEHTRQLSAPAKIAYDAGRRRIGITLPPEHASQSITGRIQLYRPSEADLDRQLKLQTDTQGRQWVDASDLQPGLWKLRLVWAVGNREFSTDQPVVIKAQR